MVDSEITSNQFEGDRPPQAEIVCEIHFAHAACAD
jgi:hypothetical protein